MTRMETYVTSLRVWHRKFCHCYHYFFCQNFSCQIEKTSQCEAQIKAHVGNRVLWEIPPRYKRALLNEFCKCTQIRLTKMYRFRLYNEILRGGAMHDYCIVC